VPRSLWIQPESPTQAQNASQLSLRIDASMVGPQQPGRANGLSVVVDGRRTFSSGLLRGAIAADQPTLRR